MDYGKTSDFDDVSGHWHVEELEPSKCRVFYACDIKMKGNVPGPILNYISKQALKQATAWVKRESEANPTKTPPALYGVKSSHHFLGHAASSEDAASSQPKRGWGMPSLLPKRKLQ